MRQFAVAACAPLLVAACGKLDATPGVVGVYHLEEDGAATLEVGRDGTYRVDVASCAKEREHETSVGAWARGAEADEGTIRFTETAWWPTPRSYPQTYLRWVRLERDGDDLVVSGYHPDGGRFEQTWKPGNRCLACGVLGRRILACGGGVARSHSPAL